MPPRGVQKGSKRGRQYEHVKQSLKEQGRSEPVADDVVLAAWELCANAIAPIANSNDVFMPNSVLG